MKKLKNFWKKLECFYSKKRPLVIVLGLFFILLLSFGIYYGVALARISEAEINLATLREEINSEKICHEDCLSIRKNQEAIIIAAIKKPEANLLKRLADYFNDSKESFEFKNEIINLWRLNDSLESVPQYFYNYLDKENGDVKLQTLIINSFLSADNDGRWLDYYFNLLASKRNVSLKKAALIALSNRKDKASDFNLKQLVFLKNLLFSSDASLEIRTDLVLLIGEYYPYFPDDTTLILLEVYDDKKLDNITRAFAADILNRNNKEEKLVLPAISGPEWENYYNY
ncbi:MAG: hypothetical protein ACYC40_04240 [Patescibacteria group bacterium]